MRFVSSARIDKATTESCPTTQHAFTIMAQRDTVGVKKYGQTVDENTLTASEWAQQAIEELADGLKYAIRAKEEADELTYKLSVVSEACVQLEAGNHQVALQLLKTILPH